MDNSSFQKILDFKNKLLPDKQLLSLKAWFAKYDFTVQHIKGDKNSIPNFLTRPSINKPTFITSIQTIPIIAMNRSLPFKALTQKGFPLNLYFSLAFQIQDFAKKFLFRYFMNVYRTQPLRFPSIHLEYLNYSMFGVSQSCMSLNLSSMFNLPSGTSQLLIMHHPSFGHYSNGFHHSHGGVNNFKISQTVIS